MLKKMLFRFGKEVRPITTYQQLQNIMRIPTPENYQKLQYEVQELIQSNHITWKFIHRVQLLKEQFSLKLDMPYLLSQVKNQPIEPQQFQFIVEIMQQNFMIDDVLFKNIFKQLLEIDELLFTTQLKMLETFFQYPDYFDQSNLLPKLIQNMIKQDNLDIFDLVSAFKVFTYKSIKLTEVNKQQLQDFRDTLNKQIIKILPALGQKQFRQLLVVLRHNQYFDEQLKQAIFQYFFDCKDYIGESSLIELLNLCNLKQYFHENIKYQILIQLNFLKIQRINESKIMQKSPQSAVLSQQELEMIANLVTLSGIYIDKEFILTHFTGSNSQKREKLEQMQTKVDEIAQIVSELLQYINGQFDLFLNVMQTIKVLDLKLPELLQPLMEELKMILTKQIVNPSDLLDLLNYFDESDILFDQEDSIGMQYFNNYLNQESFTEQKINYLQRQFAHKKNQQLIKDLLEKSYNSKWTLELCSRQALIFNYFKIPLSNAFKIKFYYVIEDYILKKRSVFDKILFYKYINFASWEQNLRKEHLHYYLDGEYAATRMKREKTKNLDLSSFLEQEINNDLLQYMPKTLKLLNNEYLNGIEIDFIIMNEKGEKLYVQVHGQTHFYYQSTVQNYKTLLETLYLEQKGKLKLINYYETDQWKLNRQKAVEKLISCLL